MFIILHLNSICQIIYTILTININIFQFPLTRLFKHWRVAWDQLLGQNSQRRSRSWGRSSSTPTAKRGKSVSFKHTFPGVYIFTNIIFRFPFNLELDIKILVSFKCQIKDNLINNIIILIYLWGINIFVHNFTFR